MKFTNTASKQNICSKSSFSIIHLYVVWRVREMANKFDIGKISFYFIVQDNIIGWEITSCRMVQKLWKLVMLFRGLGIIKTIETNELQYCLDGLKWVLHINVLGDNTFPFRHKSIHHYRETFPSFVHVMQIFRSYMTDNIGNTHDAPDHPNYCQ